MRGPPSLIGEELLEELADMARSTPPGHFVEVGVYKGGSAWYLSKVAIEQGRELHLFDTFNGIPHALPEDNNRVGEFGDTDVEKVMALVPDAYYYVGLFPNTLPDELTGVAFVHVDCDQYQSVRDVIDELGPRMVPGGVMWFDDYGCTWGANKAVNESFDGRIERTRALRGYVRF